LVWAGRLTGHFPAFLDSVNYVFPEKWVNTTQWASGTIPLWNPWIACGTPHLAQSQPACFYPPFFLWVWTGLSDWIFYVSLFHTAWALVGFFLWARRKGVSPTTAWLGAGSFAFCAMGVIYWGFVSHVATLSWIPWVFLALDRAIEKGNALRWAIFSIALAMQTLAGYAYFSLYTYVALVVYVVWGSNALERPWKYFFTASLGAFFLSAVQILPFLDYGHYANRPVVDLFALRPMEILTLFWPDLLGTPSLKSYKGALGHFIFNPYFGLVPLIGVVLALWFRVKQARFFSWFSVLALIFLMGLPFLPMILEPAKSAPIFVFLAVTAGTLYWNRWADLKKSPRWLILLGTVVWVVDIFVLPFRMVPVVHDPYRFPTAVQDAAQLRQWAGEGRILTLRPSGSFYPADKQGSPEASLDYHVRWATPNSNAVWGIRSIGGYLSSSVDGFQNVHVYLEHGVRNERLLDVAGVKTLMGLPPPPFKKFTVQQTLADVPVTRNAGAQASVWCVPYVREFPDRPAVFNALMDPSAFVEQEVFTEKSPKGGAVRLAPPLRELSGSSAASYGWWEKLLSGWRRWRGGRNTVLPVRLSPCREEATADFREPGWMVWNESYAPGWRAWVDGKPQSIFRAYGLFMAVPVNGTGLHRVAFRYEPTAFRLGLFISLSAWAGWIGWFFALAVRGGIAKRKKSSPHLRTYSVKPI
jgi:hypothetical protein